MTAPSDRPRWEVADVVRLYGASYQAQRQPPSPQWRVMRHIKECRTAALGGHMEACDSCDHQRPVYNSCRDRHCPKCQTMTKEKWLEARKAELLPVDYFHKVFTIPHELNGLTLANKRVVLKILFRAASETLLQFGRDPRSRIGGQVGFTLVLHTWNQQLLDHFHLHCVIPAGALSTDGKTWIRARHPRYLFSVKALSIVFRGKFLDHLKRAYTDDRLLFPEALTEYKAPQRFDCLLEQLRSKNWIVYSKAPFGGPERVLEYLGRYTHRVAISNQRLVDVSVDGVTFSYRDRADNSKKRVATISGHEFLRRFLLHVLPRGFMRIRHYGFFASRGKRKMLSQCRAALGVEAPPIPAAKTPAERLLEVAGIDVLKCPCCKHGRMKRGELLLKTENQRIRTLGDLINTS